MHALDRIRRVGPFRLAPDVVAFLDGLGGNRETTRRYEPPGFVLKSDMIDGGEVDPSVGQVMQAVVQKRERLNKAIAEHVVGNAFANPSVPLVDLVADALMFHGDPTAPRPLGIIDAR